MRTCACLISLLVVVSAGGPAMADAGFVEDFSTDPIAAGRWTVLDGGGAGRFTYDPGAQALTAHYDTTQPTARLIREIGALLDETNSFHFAVDFEIRSDGYFQLDDTDYMDQIAFGMIDRARTGPVRTSWDGTAFNEVCMDYFPNNTLWSEPSLCPTVITSDPGTMFWYAVMFAWGDETELKAAHQESPLPFDTPLTAEVKYVHLGSVGRVTLRILRDGVGLPINRVGAAPVWGSPDGGADHDITTITTTLDYASTLGFTVDSFGLLLWNDQALTTPILKADVVFRRVSVAVGDRPTDFDHDGDADLGDFGLFQACFNGPNASAASGCAADADLDADNDVDLMDFGLFQGCFNGPNRPVPAGCS